MERAERIHRGGMPRPDPDNPACECTILPKAVWPIKQHDKRPPNISVSFRRLLRLQRALAEVVLHVPSESKNLSIEKKVRAIKWRPWVALPHDKNQLHVEVKQEVQRCMEQQHEMLPKKWKAVAREWKVADSKVFAHLRNPSNSKVQCLSEQGVLRSDLMRIQDSLMAFWARLENWSWDDLAECMRRLERARYLPLQPERLAPIISTGCLSLLDFVNLPTQSPYKPVASLVGGMFWGAVRGVRSHLSCPNHYLPASLCEVALVGLETVVLCTA